MPSKKGFIYAKMDFLSGYGIVFCKYGKDRLKDKNKSVLR